MHFTHLLWHGCALGCNEPLSVGADPFFISDRAGVVKVGLWRSRQLQSHQAAFKCRRTCWELGSAPGDAPTIPCGHCLAKRFCLVVSGGRPSGGAAAGSPAGLGPLLVLLHSVSRGQSLAACGFPALPDRGQGKGGQGLLFSWCGLAFQPTYGSHRPQGLRRVAGRAEELAGRSSWLVSVLLARGSVHRCSPCSRVCAACSQLSLSRCIPQHWRCPSPGPGGGSVGGWRCLVQGVFCRRGWLPCTSQVELTPFSPPCPQSQACAGRCWQQVSPRGSWGCRDAREGMGRISSGNSWLSAHVHTCAAVGLPSAAWKGHHAPCAMVLWPFVEEQRDAVETFTLLLVLATFVEISEGCVFPASTLGSSRLCQVMAMAPERLSPIQHRNGAGTGPGEAGTMAQMKN